MKLIPTSERIPLVVVGQRTFYTCDVLAYAEQNDLSEFLIFPNNVTTQELPAIYQSSSIFLYTSLYEGFGIPVLEALASGVPVITSNTSSLPEAAGPSSRLIEPLSAEQTADSIMQLTWERELREEIINNGYLYCQKFENSEVTKLLRYLVCTVSS
jgi:glycosyltransferase involved in cell wall biosynthesis